MKQPSTSMVAFQKRQADREKQRTERDADIRARFKAGATLHELGRKYQITMERVRQIARDKTAPDARHRPT
jgi:Mor family transcriptional regulator